MTRPSPTIAIRIVLGVALASAATVGWFTGFVEIANRLVEDDSGMKAFLTVGTTFLAAGGAFYVIVRHAIASIIAGVVVPVAIWIVTIWYFFAFQYDPH